MDSRARFHNDGNQIQRHEFKRCCPFNSFSLRKGSNLILHSPFIFKGRGEEEVGLRPDLTRCRQHTFKWENWGKRGMEGGTQPKEQVVGNKKRRHGTGENSRSPCILQGLSLRFTSPKKSHSGTQRRMDRAFQVPHEKRNT